MGQDEFTETEEDLRAELGKDPTLAEIDERIEDNEAAKIDRVKRRARANETIALLYG